MIRRWPLLLPLVLATMASQAMLVVLSPTIVAIQLPDHPGTMMAARTGATQLGYLVGAALGGVVIAAAGYKALSIVLAAGMTLSALLVLRVSDRSDAPLPAMSRDLSRGMADETLRP